MMEPTPLQEFWAGLRFLLAIGGSAAFAFGLVHFAEKKTTLGRILKVIAWGFILHGAWIVIRLIGAWAIRSAAGIP